MIYHRIGIGLPLKRVSGAGGMFDAGALREVTR